VSVVLDHDWFPTALPHNVTIGERSWCYSAFAFVHYCSRRPCGVRIGHDTGIYAGTFFDLGPSGRVEIGNFCTLVGAIIATNRRVVIEDYAFLAHEVVLADSAAMTPPQAELAVVPEADAEPPAIVLGQNSWVGARAVLLAGAKIGQGAIIGAGTVVDFEVPPYAVVAGNPARIVAWAHERNNDQEIAPAPFRQVV
jgi:acetyltransferase-like isoleucine patch superfamily enzyme